MCPRGVTFLQLISALTIKPRRKKNFRISSGFAYKIGRQCGAAKKPEATIDMTKVFGGLLKGARRRFLKEDNAQF